MSRPGPIADSVERLISILRHVPRQPRHIDGATLERRLADEGIRVTRRSIQRDLEKLAARFVSLRCDDSEKPYRWSWDGETPIIDIPGMGLSAAVTLEMVRAHLTAALPRTTFRSLVPYFARARDVLAAEPDAKMARWPAKIRVIPRGVSLAPPDVSADVLDAVYGALLEERLLEVRYRPRGATSDKNWKVHPVALIVRDGVLALVSMVGDYEDVVHLHLHRMKRASRLELPARQPPGFSLDRYFEQGGGAFRLGDPVRFRARLHPEVARTLEEARLGKDQVIEPEGERFLLKVTVADTLELRGWIKSYGAAIEVLAPAAFRRDIAAELKAAAALYRA